MLPLPKTFTKGGMTYEQVLRDGNVAIYRQTKPGQSWELFEVGKVNQNKAYTIAGNDIPARESWPSSESWGLAAWTCQTLKSAKERAFALLDGVQACQNAQNELTDHQETAS